ncbi:ectonucleotide pyrophosphatase phosphodiesterase [Xylographa opegraphella]|nr:ectonucleotide pyrophosphatase phosphodiesterase [Xylographa opegraphella]
MEVASNPDSDDGALTREPLENDRDVLRENFERAQLLEDPSIHNNNQPGDSRRSEKRKSRRRQRKERKKIRTRDEGGTLLYEMEEGGNGVTSPASSRSSMERETVPPRRNSRFKKVLHLVLIPIVIIVVLCLLVFGAYKRSAKPIAQAAMESLSILSNGTSKFAPTTILISLDGFRADFLNRGLTPTLNSFVAEGVSPRYMLPSFPSVTFPNHYTLVTGLYPESHGVVGNSFWDTELQEEFFYTDPARSMQPKWWIEGEPIWVTAAEQNVTSAIHMWPGSEAHIQIEPAFLDKYNGTEVLSRKVDRILDFIDMPGEFDPGAASANEFRPRFIAFYVPNVDAHGHLNGPNSTAIRATIHDVDLMLQDLFAGLQERNLTDVINIVVVSDHGMASTSVDRLIQLEDLVEVNMIEHIDGWPLYGLRPKDPNDLPSIYEKLSGKAANNPNIEVYLRDENMPERYHFSKNKRIAPLWIIPKTGWAIVKKADFDIAEARRTGRIYRPQGLHGYDHEHPLMRAIFVARGPAFPHQPNSRLEVFQNIEVYNIVCDSLGIEPRPNNGTLRLPLKPVGLHSDELMPADEPAIDPPVSALLPQPSLSASPYSSPVEAITLEPIPPRPTVDAGNDIVDETGTEELGGDDDREEVGMSDWWHYLVDKVTTLKEWTAELFKGTKSKDSELDDER